MDQSDIIVIFRAFHPKTMNFIIFLSAHGTFSRVGHILDHKSNLGKFLKFEIISNIFSDHNKVTLNINYRGEKTIKNTNLWRLNNKLVNKQWTLEEIIKSKYA